VEVRTSEGPGQPWNWGASENFSALQQRTCHLTNCRLSSTRVASLANSRALVQSHGQLFGDLLNRSLSAYHFSFSFFSTLIAFFSMFWPILVHTFGCFLSAAWGNTCGDLYTRGLRKLFRKPSCRGARFVPTVAHPFSDLFPSVSSCKPVVQDFCHAIFVSHGGLLSILVSRCKRSILLCFLFLALLPFAESMPPPSSGSAILYYCWVAQTFGASPLSAAFCS
jgi:hypothetical protein